MWIGRVFFFWSKFCGLGDRVKILSESKIFLGMKIFWELTGIFREPCKNKNILFRWEKNIYLVWSVYIPTLPLSKY